MTNIEASLGHAAMLISALVFGYPGFVVADGSVMPGPVGPNPSNTSATLAHRFAERMTAGGRAGNS